jgi:hypothetical protein
MRSQNTIPDCFEAVLRNWQPYNGLCDTQAVDDMIAVQVADWAVLYVNVGP